MVRISTGNASPFTTGTSGCPFTVIDRACVGHSATHSPQKLHLAASMSTRGFSDSRPSLNTTSLSVIASRGQTISQMRQPQHFSWSAISS